MAQSVIDCCGNHGPGYPSPLVAMRDGPREKVLYIVCPRAPGATKPDYLATVNIDETSPNYLQVVHRLPMPYVGDELHHSGWNTCSSCYDNPKKSRDRLILPGLNSSRVYIVDTGSDPMRPKMHKVIEPEVMMSLNASAPHTTHCAPNGQIMISTMGDAKGNPRGNFVCIDTNSLEMTGLWSKDDAIFGYDFWYQPFWDVLIASEWASPNSYSKGFCIEDAHNTKLYGRSLNVYSWSSKKLLQTIELGLEGIAPLEIRFLHNPKEPQGYVGAALYSKIFRFYRKEDGKWATEKVIDIPSKKVEGWKLPEMNGLISDVLISLDDRFLYVNCWLHGDIRQYDITDPSKPRLVAQLYTGGSLLSDSPVKVINDPEMKTRPNPLYVKGRRIEGGPQMMQLSLDGKRLYMSNSLYTVWDKQFYPDLVQNGSSILRINVDTDKGGLTVDKDFLIDFGKEPDGPILAHEIRYPGGDCTSDIWLAPKD